jgi:hypothetical protein
MARRATTPSVPRNTGSTRVDKCTRQLPQSVVMGRWREQECDLALRLRDRLAILECPERRAAPAAAASAALRPNRQQTAAEERRG